MKKPDPKKGTGKKPKGSGRRLYTDENPKDTIRIKFATLKDATETVEKVKRVRRSFARKIQILTVLEQRAKVAGKFAQAKVAKSAKEAGEHLLKLAKAGLRAARKAARKVKDAMKKLAEKAKKAAKVVIDKAKKLAVEKFKGKELSMNMMNN